MGKAKKTRKFAVAKKIISPKDTRVNSVAVKAAEKKEKEAKKAEPRQVEQGVSALFFQYNTQLGEWINVEIQSPPCCAYLFATLCVFLIIAYLPICSFHLQTQQHNALIRPALSCAGRYKLSQLFDSE